MEKGSNMTNSPSRASTRACPSIEAIHESAREAVGASGLGPDFTPLVPSRWPPQGATAVLFVYHSEPLPTGTTSYRIYAPSQRIEFHTDQARTNVGAIPNGTTPKFATPEVTHLSDAHPLGSERSADPAFTLQELRESEQALLELIFGCSTLEDVAPRLRAYRAWFERHPLLARDLAVRVPGFFEWLRASPRAPGSAPSR
jgi:hypothetical protein